MNGTQTPTTGGMVCAIAGALAKHATRNRAVNLDGAMTEWMATRMEFERPRYPIKERSGYLARRNNTSKRAYIFTFPPPCRYNNTARQ